MKALASRFDVVIVGGGHNGLTAAAYLAQAGRTVLLVEEAHTLEGAGAVGQVFDGVPARLPRYSYLVSPMPRQIIDELDLQVVLHPRRYSSYTPVPGRADGRGLLVDSEDPQATRDAFDSLSVPGQFDSWREFYGRAQQMASKVFPTLLQRLSSREELRRYVADEAIWRAVFDEPLGFALEQVMPDDTVRGTALTDALIGTFASATDLSLRQNRCFLYHVVSRGPGEWPTPVGGMGIVSDELIRVARLAGARLRTGIRADGISPGTARSPATVHLVDRNGTQTTVAAHHVLLAGACRNLHTMLGRDPYENVEGSQLKVNLVLSRLPRFREDIDPRVAFARTVHVNEQATQLQTAFEEASAGRLPSTLPLEVTCQSLTDPSVLGPALRVSGAHVLSILALHTPARLFRADPEGAKARALDQVFVSLDSVLAEPIRDCLLLDAHGRPCVQASTPIDLEREAGLPGGNIFHRPLRWPFAEFSGEIGLWGGETEHPRILMAGAGARRGGGVSGIAGRNAAMAVLGH